jgi:hypothetical protein
VSVALDKQAATMGAPQLAVEIFPVVVAVVERVALAGMLQETFLGLAAHQAVQALLDRP